MAIFFIRSRGKRFPHPSALSVMSFEQLSVSRGQKIAAEIFKNVDVFFPYEQVVC